jgi:Cu(I)/Ag(I) efflux system membrane protein CusA/SilA
VLLKLPASAGTKNNIRLRLTRQNSGVPIIVNGSGKCHPDVNGDVGGRVIELAGHEYAVRGAAISPVSANRGWYGWAGHAGKAAGCCQSSDRGNIRRGLVEMNGEGEVVGGIVIMRYGENALDVINRVKQKLAEVQPAFPDGVKVVTTYDRSTLIRDSMKPCQMPWRKK